MAPIVFPFLMTSLQVIHHFGNWSVVRLLQSATALSSGLLLLPSYTHSPDTITLQLTPRGRMQCKWTPSQWSLPRRTPVTYNRGSMWDYQGVQFYEQTGERKADNWGISRYPSTLSAFQAGKIGSILGVQVDASLLCTPFSCVTVLMFNNTRDPFLL